ncbi:MAG TPA: arsenate reductase ArsC [Rhizomicrobium sp.]|nr:arsenate reductase ArsC [Rhizomicrobium sp.]
MPSQSADRIYNVLFLCTGNAARSIMGEAILNRVGNGKFRAYSAGSAPNSDVNPHTLALLRRLDFPIENLHSKSWDAFSQVDAPVLDFVFTVCDQTANEPCPVWSGQPITAHWGVPDPAAVEGDDTTIAFAFRDAFLRLERRIELFTLLPVKRLDRLSLQARLDDIGVR